LTITHGRERERERERERGREREREREREIRGGIGATGHSAMSNLGGSLGGRNGEKVCPACAISVWAMYVAPGRLI
jgi:hypothetical protein